MKNRLIRSIFALCIPLIPLFSMNKCTGSPVSAAEELFTSPPTVEAPYAEESFAEQNALLFSDGFDFTILSEENSGLLVPGDAQSKEVVEQLERGEMIGFVPLAEECLASDAILLSEAAANTASDNQARLAKGKYKLSEGVRVYCDEVWTKEKDELPYDSKDQRMATTYRTITYTDVNGKEKTSPVFCLDSEKTSWGGETIKDNAIRALTTAKVQRLLYYGYAGPGDICDDYDPTCKHIDWNKWENRYMFTHQALSKAVSGHVGNATSEEQEHIGLKRFMDYIKQFSVPTHQNVKLSGTNTSGQQQTGLSLSVNMPFYRKPAGNQGYLWKEFQQGFYMTEVITVTDSQSPRNGIRFPRGAGDTFQLLYWNDEGDFHARGLHNPRVGGTTDTKNLRAGSRFRLVFPKEHRGNKTFTFSMILKPVSYILVDASRQTGNSDYQDYGAYTYQGEEKSLSLTVVPQPYGTLRLKKTSHQNGKPVGGAQYQLYARQNLYSGNTLIYGANALIDTQTTDGNGNLVFTGLIPGNYYVRESKAPAGYLTDTASHQVTVNGNSTGSGHPEAFVQVTDIPDFTGSLSIEKRVKDKNTLLEGVEFTLYEWQTQSNSYSKTLGKCSYDAQTKRYGFSGLRYSASNKGKFLVKETKTPKGYVGAWQQEFLLSKNGQVFSYTVYNEREKLPLGEIHITKKIREEDIVWAHGNPIFTFTVNGTDANGLQRSYETFVEFQPGNYSTDDRGSAALTTVISGVPVGTYEIRENPVNRYYLESAAANTANVSIHTGQTPSYGLLPKATAYGRAALTSSALRAGITFVNQKQRFDDYSHTDVVKNTVSIKWR